MKIMGPFMRQTWTVSGVLVNVLGQGMTAGFPSCLMPALMSKDAEIQADLNMASWIASSIGIGSILGVLISSYLMSRFGRRMAHILITLPGLVGWLLIYLATDTTSLLTGRLLCGFTMGATYGLGAVVVVEYTSPKHRGMFLNLKTSAYSVGVMLVHIIGKFCHWKTVALISLIPNIVALLITATWLESPAWLAQNQKFEKSEETFSLLRGKDINSNAEITKMIYVLTEKSKHIQEISFGQKIKDLFKKFTQKDFLKPTFTVFLGVCLMEVSGRHIFPAYAFDIMREVTGSKEKSFNVILGLDLIITASLTFSSVLVKIMKRRLLLFSTGFSATAVLAVACLYLFLVSRDVISKHYHWIPIGLFIIFYILSNFGCTPMPIVYFGELFPLAHRGVGTAIGGVLMSSVMNFLLKITPYLLVNCKVYGTFAILGALMAVLLSMLYFILPETKDRTLQDIEDIFNGRQSNINDVKYKMINKNSDVKIKADCESDVKLSLL